MKKSQYQQLRSKLEADLAQAETTASSIRRKLEALDIVWGEILCPPGNPSETQPSVPDPQHDGEDVILGLLGNQHNPALSAAIDEVALAMPCPFSVQNVLTQLTAGGATVANRTTISGRLRQLADDGKLELISKGQGRRPSVYEVKQKEAEAK